MKAISIVAVVIVGAGLFFCACIEDDACTPGSTQVCVCPGGGDGAQTCMSDSSG